MTLYLDPGVLAAYYLPDPASVEAEALLCGNSGPAVSDWTEIEFAAGLVERVRHARLSASDAQRVRLRFQAHLEEGHYARLAVSPAHTRLACEWAGRRDLGVDPSTALHLALAALEGRALATTDADRARAAEALGIATIPVGVPPAPSATIHETEAAYLLSA